jgi:hypothetical protein
MKAPQRVRRERPLTSHTRAITTTLAGALAITAACANFHPHVGQSPRSGAVIGTGRTQDPTVAGDIGGRGLPSGRPGAATQTATAGPDARRICRTSSRPTGWIAVAYVAGDASCASRSSADSAHAVAVLTRYDILPVSAVLEVCADERIPKNWVPDATPAVPSDACPGVNGNPTSTTRLIQRLR